MCVYVYIYIYIYLYIHVLYVYTYICIYIHICIHMPIHYVTCVASLCWLFSDSAVTSTLAFGWSVIRLNVFNLQSVITHTLMSMHARVRTYEYHHMIIACAHAGIHVVWSDGCKRMHMHASMNTAQRGMTSCTRALAWV